MWRKASLKLASAAALCAALIATIGLQAANANSGRTALRGTAATSRARAHRVGAVSRSTRESFDLVLKLRNRRGAVALLKAVSTPGSSSYRHYLTTAQWEARFSPTRAQVAKARKWLRSEGFRVGAVSKDRMTISASGTAAQVERAFGTQLGRYRVRGHIVQLASRDFSVPASVAGTVLGAVGINQYVERPSSLGSPDLPGSGSTTGASSSSGYPPPPPAFIPAPPCGAYYAAKSTTLKPPFGHGYPNTVPDVVCGYKPPQFRSAYGVGSPNMGQGYKVAIVDAYDSSTIASDATTYFKKNDPSNPFSRAHLVRRDSMPFTRESFCDASSWLVEQAIDIEAVHGMAGNAHVVYVGAKNCFDSGLMAADRRVIDNHLADVISNSWGDPSGDVLDDTSTQNAYNNLFLLAGTTGITVQYSSGDDGDNFDLTGISAPGFPDSSPFATSVGGTTTKINSAGQRTGDLGWATGRSFLCTANGVNILPGCTKGTLGTWGPVLENGMSGGYTSYRYLQPYYQKGIVPKALSERNAPIFGSQPLRVTPDISLDADPGTGFLIGITQSFKSGAHYSQTRYGGTSLASPLLAGVVAVTDQTAGQPTGFLNPTIYKVDRTKPSAIYDVLAEKGKQANYRRDYASAIVPGVKGYFQQVRELYFGGPEVYCDGAGNCAQRPNTLSAFKGYDSLTGLGSPGKGFIAAIAGS